MSHIFHSERGSGESDINEESDFETSDEDDDVLARNEISEVCEMTSEDDEELLPVRKRRLIHIQSEESDEGEGGYGSRTEDQNAEGCPVCLSSFIGQDLGTPENCNHIFCLECIMEWSRNINTCPIDRNSFKYVHLKTKPNGKVVKRIQVQVASQEPEADLQEEVTTLCEVCRCGDQEDRLLLCDACDLAYHCECLDPPLFHIPIEEWFCPPCSGILENGAVGGSNFHRSRRVIPRTSASETVRTRVQNRRIQTTSSSRSTSTTRGRKRRCSYRKSFKKIVKLARTKQSSSSAGKGGASERSTRILVTFRRRRRKKRRRVGKKSAKLSKKEALIKGKQSTKDRLSKCLGLFRPHNGTAIPDVRPQSESATGAEKQASHAIFGRRDQLMDFNEDFNEDGPSTSSGVYRSRVEQTEMSCASSLDLLDSIMAGQKVLHSKSETVMIKSDGSLVLKKERKLLKTTPRDDNLKSVVGQGGGLFMSSRAIASPKSKMSHKTRHEIEDSTGENLDQNSYSLKREPFSESSKGFKSIAKCHSMKVSSKNNSVAHPVKLSNEIKKSGHYKNGETYHSTNEKLCLQSNTKCFPDVKEKFKIKVSDSMEFATTGSVGYGSSESPVLSKAIATSSKDLYLNCNLEIKEEANPEGRNDSKVVKCKTKVLGEDFCLKHSKNCKNTAPRPLSFQSKKIKIEELQNKEGEPMDPHFSASHFGASQYRLANNLCAQHFHVDSSSINLRSIKKESLSSDEELCPKTKPSSYKYESADHSEKLRKKSTLWERRQTPISNVGKKSPSYHLKSSRISGLPSQSTENCITNTSKLPLAEVHENSCTQLAGEDQQQSGNAQSACSPLTSSLGLYCTQLTDFSSVQSPKDDLPCTQLADFSYVQSPKEDLPCTQLADFSSVQSPKDDLPCTQLADFSYVQSPKEDLPCTQLADFSSVQSPEDGLPCTQLLDFSTKETSEKDFLCTQWIDLNSKPSNQHLPTYEHTISKSFIEYANGLPFAHPASSSNLKPSWESEKEVDVPCTQLLCMSPARNASQHLQLISKSSAIFSEGNLHSRQIAFPYLARSTSAHLTLGDPEQCIKSLPYLPCTQLSDPLATQSTNSSPAKSRQHLFPKSQKDIQIATLSAEEVFPTQLCSSKETVLDSVIANIGLPTTQIGMSENSHRDHNNFFLEAGSNVDILDELPPTQLVAENKMDSPEKAKSGLDMNSLNLLPARHIGVHRHLPQVMSSVPIRSMPLVKPIVQNTFSFEQVKWRSGGLDTSDSDLFRSGKWKRNRASLATAPNDTTPRGSCMAGGSSLHVQNGAEEALKCESKQLVTFNVPKKDEFCKAAEEEMCCVVSSKLPLEIKCMNSKDISEFSPVVKKELDTETVQPDSVHEEKNTEKLGVIEIKQEPVYSEPESEQDPSKRPHPSKEVVRKEVCSRATCDGILKIEQECIPMQSSKMKKEINSEMGNKMKKDFKSKNDSGVFNWKNSFKDQQGRVSHSCVEKKRSGGIQKRTTGSWFNAVCNPPHPLKGNGDEVKLKKCTTSEKMKLVSKDCNNHTQNSRKCLCKEPEKGLNKVNVAIKQTMSSQSLKKSSISVEHEKRKLKSDLKLAEPYKKKNWVVIKGNKYLKKSISPEQNTDKSSLVKFEHTELNTHRTPEFVSKAVNLEKSSTKEIRRHGNLKNSESNSCLNTNLSPIESKGKFHFADLKKERLCQTCPKAPQSDHKKEYNTTYPSDNLEQNSSSWVPTLNTEQKLVLLKDEESLLSDSNEELLPSSVQCQKETLQSSAHEINSSSFKAETEFETAFVQFEKMSKKSDSSSKNKEHKMDEWHGLKEEIASEVKIVLKPFYTVGVIDKEDYKNILRRAVPKVFLNCGKTVNPDKIKKLVLNYISKLKHA